MKTKEWEVDRVSKNWRRSATIS